jgi:hypothetical protein
MKSIASRIGVAAWALIAVALVLIGLLGWEWQQGMNLRQSLLAMRKVPVTEVPAQEVLPAFVLPNVQTGFPEMAGRPVFSLGRRYPPPADKVVSVMKKGQFVLVGVLVTPKMRAALLRDAQTNKTETVVMGSVIRGITLGDVGANGVTLRQGEESEELALQIQRGAKLPPVAVAPPGPRP